MRGAATPRRSPFTRSTRSYRRFTAIAPGSRAPRAAAIPIKGVPRNWPAPRASRWRRTSVALPPPLLPHGFDPPPARALSIAPPPLSDVRWWTRVARAGDEGTQSCPIDHQRRMSTHLYHQLTAFDKVRDLKVEPRAWVYDGTWIYLYVYIM
jgi:hypothetical protein